MIQTSTSHYLVLLALHLFLGAMIFAHGFYKVFRGGKLAGTAKWFDSIGMRPGWLNARMAAGTELGAGVALMLGVVTPVSAGALVALMVVAIATVHRKNGFFVFNKGQGMEYCLAVMLAAITLGASGSGKYSIDYLLRHHSFEHWLNRPVHALATTVVLGFGGAALQLAAVYRPSKATAST